MKKVLFIVIAYNGMQWLERCLGSVPAWADLYVFDNDSTDGSADFVTARFPRARLVRSAENLGFSRPNNLGFEYARKHGYDYVYLLNQDAWLEEGALEKLVAAAEAHPEYGVLSPLQMTDGYKEFDKQFSKVLGKRIASLSESSGGGTELLEVRRVMAAHWLVPVRVIGQIGPFEEELFPFYGQDDDWCNRLHFCGLKVGVVPAARAVHDRAYRQEPLKKVIHRNFYTGSLVRLANPSKSIFENFLFVIPFTFVKAFKYRSLLPFKYLRKIFKDLPRVKKLREDARMRSMCAKKA